MMMMDAKKVNHTRPTSPHQDFSARSPPRVVSHSFVTKQHGLQLKVSDPYISMDKKLATLNIPCETPLHYTPPPPFPETSPSEHKMMIDGDFGKRKKGTRRGTLNPEAKNVLKAWMFSPEHFAHPYPSEEEKEELAAEAGIEVKQLSNWFTNARKRLWQPVLRQSGVEVKNFLSTGRGGPRGAKLDVPTNIPFIHSSSSPPSSPQSPLNEDEDESAPTATSTSDKVVKRMRPTTTNDDSHDRDTTSGGASPASTSSDDSWNDRRTGGPHGFRDVEILAAKSLLGLQREYQSVH
ncbi:hypothetical protein LEN26_008439 [Aphanomyces euteiches]|uniref:Homeobox domain-containing protein n=1 Tax=Aphanomyces euteiches TaxID=100861 RepID=A0A6G0W7J9_9STRA|nr:hypothetical protein Ae201684_017842 [Aphanomyces euteiches]KAH9072427.1 hypothetical protein Ae201684P_022005 [Aphanomyces euteiches]KAH9124249.1 hypothetical protein AeMF1_004939 [Aphanomyces euteiches]KAH9130511.1 hypothetical protein LEN26_008439 [Aphanomyces euteiches]KAH9141843.1 hypothetical protein AeRB84_014048 [Aphanomyces euteiches]